jgi:hypothetical protein
MQLSPLLEAAGGAYAHYVSALAALARADFERTKAAADRFNRDEIRIAARLIVARSVLAALDADTAPPRDGFNAAGIVGSAGPR